MRIFVHIVNNSSHLGAKRGENRAHAGSAGVGGRGQPGFFLGALFCDASATFPRKPSPKRPRGPSTIPCAIAGPSDWAP